jgi:preprotein translocase subunit YajC
MLASYILASTDGDKSSGGGAAFQLIFFLLIGLAMYFLLIRPQRRRMREAQQLVSTLAEGDEVITTGGVYGFINAIDGDTIWLDIAENVEIRIHRSAIARKIDPAKEPAGGPTAIDAPGDESTDAPTDAPADDDEH